MSHPKQHQSSNRLIAYSVQHIIAKSTDSHPSPLPVTISFSFLPVHNRPSPTWYYTLPKITNSTSNSLDYLLFSPDGNQLLISTLITQEQPNQKHPIQLLRLSLLTQSNAKADYWSLTWDHLLSTPTQEPCRPSQIRTVCKACFLAESRRWFTEPARNQPNTSDEKFIEIRSTNYLIPRRTPNSIINLFAQGKGQTAILVLSTNELLVIHIPLPHINLPPHILLTRLDDTTLASEPLKLIPTPTLIQTSNQYDSNNRNFQRPSNLDPNRPISALPSTSSKDRQPNHLRPSPIPTINDSATNPDRSIPNNSSATGPKVTSNQKQISIAAIGLPSSSGRTIDHQLDHPRILIGYQTRTTPPIPSSIFQTTVLIDGAEDQDAKSQAHQNEFQFASSIGVVDNDLGEFITGLGDLDEAFDVPMMSSTAEANEASKTKANGPAEGQEKLKHDSHAGNPQDLSGSDQKLRKPSISLRNKNHAKDYSRRFEPVLGADDDGLPYTGSLDGSTFDAFIQLAQISIDFDHPGLVPTVTVQQLPKLPITDPFDYSQTTQVTLRTLEFASVITGVHGSNPEPHPPSLRLIAGYSREFKHQASSDRAGPSQLRSADELQSWDLRFQHPRLSNAFLAIDCLVDRHPCALSPPDLMLRGPPEWIFTRAANKRLVESHADDDQIHSSLKICNILLNWKVRSECLILVVQKTTESVAESFGANTTTTGDVDAGEEDTVARKKQKVAESASLKYECIIINSKDLTTVAAVPLPPSLGPGAVNHLALSYHGIWCCSLEEHSGKIRALPLVRSKETEALVSLVVSAIYNREPVDDICRLFGSTPGSSTAAHESASPPSSEFDHPSIFQHISSFLAQSNPLPKSFELDFLLSPSWGIGYDLWSATPGYKNAAEIALIGKQLFSAQNITNGVRSEIYARSVWQMIGMARWYSRLCQRILGSIHPDSKSAHLCLLMTTSCPLSFLFKMVLSFHQFARWLTMMKTPSMIAQHRNIQVSVMGGPEGGKAVRLTEELQIARMSFVDIWEESNLINMDSWTRMLQDLGRSVFMSTSKSGIDPSKVPVRQAESFSAPLAATDPNQVKESVEMLTGFMANYPQLIKTPAGGKHESHARAPSVAGGATAGAAAAGGAPENAETEEERNAKRLATLWTMGSQINVEEDRRQYDVLTGARLELSFFPPGRASDCLIGGADHRLGSFKECLKCRSRASTLLWNYHLHRGRLPVGARAPQQGFSAAGAGGGSLVGPFDVSLKEFNGVCVCGGCWVSPAML